MPEERATHPTPQSLGAAIKAARTALGWSQGDLADRLAVPASTIGNWETDRHRPTRHAQQLEQLLGITVPGTSEPASPREVNLQRVGQVIRNARKAKGWTQQEAADAAGVAVRTLGAWERGLHWPGTQVAQLEEALGVAVMTEAFAPDEAEPTSITDLRSRVRDLTDEELDGLFADLAAEKLRRTAPP